MLGQVTSATFVTRGGRGQDILNVNTVLDVPPSMSFGTARVTIVPAKGLSSADRDLTVVYYYKSYGGSYSNHVAIRKNIRLAEGQPFVVVDIPQFHVARQYAWDVQIFENGRDIEDRRRAAPNEADFQWQYEAARGENTALLVGLNDSTAEIQDQVNAISELYSNGQAGVNTPYNVRLMPVNDAYADWRQYFPFSHWVISAKTLGDLDAQRPELLKALKNYVAAGGKLLVYSVSSEQDRGKVESFFSADNQAELLQAWGKIKAPSAPWWMRQDDSVVVANSMSASSQITGGNVVYATPSGTIVGPQVTTYDMAGNIIQPPMGTASPTPSTARTRTADMVPKDLRGSGVVYDAVIAAETWGKLNWGGHVDNLSEWIQILDPGRESPLGTLEPQVQQIRDQWMTAVETESILIHDYLNGRVLLSSKSLRDISPRLLQRAMQTTSTPANQAIVAEFDGDWFWRNLISAVGKPPVWMFCGIVALFGALLGPGLLLFTGRVKRRSLMIFLVPSLSLLATLSIILYSVLHEGFDTYIRVNSVQFVDPETGDGFVWSRQNYFSGLPPREGLNFRYDTYVRPVSIDEPNSNGNLNPRNADFVVNLAENQNWRGWLKARQQQQLVVGHPTERGALPVSVEQAEGEQLKVTNLTEREIPLVAIRGAADNYYFSESLAPGASVVLESKDRISALTNVGRIMAELRPDVPPELNARGSLGGFGSRRSNMNIGGGYQQDVINNFYTKYLSERAELPNFGIVSVLTESDRVEVPLEGRSDENLHVVIGVQPW